MDPDPLRQPSLNTLGDGLTVVNRRIIQDDQREAVRADLRKMIERGDDLRAPDPARVRIKIGFIRPIEQPQDVQPLPTAPGEFVGHPRRLPGIRHARDQIKAGGIKIENIELATGFGRSQPR